jgi:Mg-chelatase subunit ChlD
MTPITHIYFLLDRSGSMASVADDVIGGFNAFLAAQRRDGEDARMTFVQFDSHDPFEVLVDAKPIARVRDLTPATFRPRGSTPLLDATGDLVAHATLRVEHRKALGKRPEEIVVVTFTDGFENASRRYQRGDVLRLVATKEAEGWTFVFLGAGPDAYGESAGVGYDARAVQAFAADSQGVSLAFDSLSAATARHRAKLRDGMEFDKRDFFEGDKRAEDDRRRRRGSGGRA